MYTHLNILTAQSYSQGATITGNTSGATGIFENTSSTETATITGATQANPMWLLVQVVTNLEKVNKLQLQVLVV